MHALRTVYIERNHLFAIRILHILPWEICVRFFYSLGSQRILYCAIGIWPMSRSRRGTRWNGISFRYRIAAWNKICKFGICPLIKNKLKLPTIWWIKSIHPLSPSLRQKWCNYTHYMRRERCSTRSFIGQWDVVMNRMLSHALMPNVWCVAFAYIGI